MNDAKKKAIEIAIIVIGSVFLLMRLLHPSAPANKRRAPLVRTRMAEQFNLPEAKKTLETVGGAEKNEGIAESHIRDILQEPAEVTKLEENTARGVSGQVNAPDTRGLELEGIMFGGEKGNLAIISGRVVAEGEMLDDAKVEKIEQDRVILLKNGSRVELKR